MLRQRLTEMLATKSAKVFVEKSGKIIGPSSLSKVLTALTKAVLLWTIRSVIQKMDRGFPYLGLPCFL